LGLDNSEVVPGNMIFDLLFQNTNSLNEVVAEGSATAEASQFWQQEEQEFTARMQVSDSGREEEENIVLPDDIMPSFDQMIQT
jgi:hypothetical protein